MHHIEQVIYQPEENVCDMATIRNPWGASPHLTEAARYFSSLTERDLTVHIADWLHIDPEYVAVCGNGSTEIISHIPQLFMKTADTCLIIQPTYFGFYSSLTESGMHVKEIKTRESSGFQFDQRVGNELTTTISAVHPSLIWICNPNNPTGTVLHQSDISAIAQNAHNALVVVDEAHQEIVDPLNVQSAIRLLDTCNNILVTKTFSKAFGIAHARIGIAIAQPTIIRSLRSSGLTEIAEDSLTIAHAALLDTGHLVATSVRIKQELGVIKSEIGHMQAIQLGSDSHIGMLLVKHRCLPLHDLLRSYGIQTDDFSKVRGLEGLGYVRIGLGTHEENARLIEALWECERTTR